MKKTASSLSQLATTLAITAIFGASLVFTGCINKEESPSSETQTEESQAESDFIMTEDANGIQDLAEGQVMYKTNKDLAGILSFYQEKLTATGLTERELLTVQSDSTLNLVFDGSENGKAMVIQAVIIGDYTNVTMRYEEI